MVVLHESVALERQQDISHWCNMDQNDNQVTHDIEILQCIRFTAVALSLKQPKITHGGPCGMCGQEESCKAES